MNRKQRVSMIVRVLLMPFTRDPFLGPDYLLEDVRVYRELVYSREFFPAEKRAAHDRARDALLRSIETEVKPDRLSELRELLEMFYPELALAEHLSQSPSGRLDRYYLDMLFRLAGEFITLRDGRVSIKMWDSPANHREFFPHSSGLYRVELWNEISRVITPDVLITAYFVQCEMRDPRCLQGLPDNIFLSDALLARRMDAGLAETHLHLSAGMNYQSVWEAVTDPSALRVTPLRNRSAYQAHQIEEQRRHQSLLAAGWLRLMMAKYLMDEDSGLDLPEYVYQRFSRDERNKLEPRLLDVILRDNVDAGEVDALLSLLKAKNEHQLDILCTDYGVQMGREALDVLARGLYRQYENLDTSPELVLLFFALWHVRRFPRHSGFQRAFLCYLRIKNGYFSDKLQSTGMSGLTYFRRYFQKAASAIHQRGSEDRRKTSLIYRAAFRNQIHCLQLKKLEVKISPPALNRELDGAARRIAAARQLKGIFEVYLEFLKEDGAPLPTLGVVYHLIRGDTSRAQLGMCWANREGGPGDLVSRTRRICAAFITELQYLLRTIPHLSEYVVGLDVASEEIYAEPWIYAPVYRQARNRRTTYPIQPDGRPMQNLGLTYHVGEDYHHVLSGLRHIDEVLTHFGYKAGDRLGHGLALQVDLAEWTHNNEVVSLPIMEHLENLLWLWSLCGEEGGELARYLPKLERDIMDLAREIYQNIRGITPYVLWCAYNRKFEALEPSFCERMAELYFYAPPESLLSCDFRRSPAQRSFCARVRQAPDQTVCVLPNVDSIWDADKLLLTHYCPVYRIHYRKPYFCANSPETLPLLQAVQACLREKIQNMGVFVEVNPTSNLAIGDIRGLGDYPVAKLNSRPLSEQSPNSVLISINSDDPLLFNTNVENELALVYHTLTYQGASRERVLEWIGKVCRYGMEGSFIREVKPVAVQRRELAEITQALELVIKDPREEEESRWSPW